MRTYKFKLYRAQGAPEKNKHLLQQIDIAGIIWNHSIALHKRYYRLTGKGLNIYVLQKHLAKLKQRPKYAYWSKVGSQAVQDITQRIDKAYKLF
ncbi:MAG: transposase, partial [Chloroflexi bacterium]|nr:transposase [Chloroflexota bacterium]